MFLASAMTCFETRLGGIGSSPQSLPQTMIDANSKINALSLKLRFNVPWYKVMPKLSSTWKALVESEDFFFGYSFMCAVFKVDPLRIIFLKSYHVLMG